MVGAGKKRRHGSRHWSKDRAAQIIASPPQGILCKRAGACLRGRGLFAASLDRRHDQGEVIVQPCKQRVLSTRHAEYGLFDLCHRVVADRLDGDVRNIGHFVRRHGDVNDRGAICL